MSISPHSPFPDQRFLAAIRNALTDLAYQGRPVTVRILEGLYPIASLSQAPSEQQAKLDFKNAKENDRRYLNEIIRDIKHIPNSRLKIYVSSVRTCSGGILCAGVDFRFNQLPYRFSANHSKLIVVDGKTVIEGGENLRTDQYLENAPVHDVSIELTGPAAAQANNFVNQLWSFICDKYRIPSLGVVTDWQAYGPDTSVCPTKINAVLRANAGNITVMSLATLGTGMFFGHPNEGHQAEVARTLFFQHANKIIRIAQQDVGLSAGPLGILWQRDNAAGNDMKALAKLILNKGDVYIVTSSYNSERLYQWLKHQLGDSYSNKVPLPKIGLKIENEIKSMNPKLSRQKIHDLVCNHLYLAPIRFSDDKEWDPKHLITNHSKIWIIDNKAFYVGSNNMYPNAMQDFGYVVGNQDLTNEFIAHYWNKLWKYSSKAAISGKGMQCQIPMLSS